MTPPGSRTRVWANLGGGPCAARVDREIRNTSGAIHGLEKCLQGGAHPATGTARRGATDAARTHVCALGHPHSRGALAASQRPRGAQQRRAPGPPGEKIPPSGDQRRRRRHRLHRNALSPGAESALRQERGATTGLSPPFSEQRGTGPRLSPAERALGEQRLGGAPPKPLLAAATNAPPTAVAPRQSPAL